MRTLIALSALAGLYAGARHFLNFMSEKNKNALRERKLEIWEGEGGAVPVAESRSGAQVKPKKRPAASPRGVS